jgi:elongation factor P
MTTSNQITPGMILSIDGKMYRVESMVRVTVPKGAPFIKTKLREVNSGKGIEKNFKLNQTVTEVALIERRLEFLYMEEHSYLFLDIANLEQVLVSPQVVGKQANFLKEGVELKASFYGSAVFSMELPQFLELTVAKIEAEKGKGAAAPARTAILETGAHVEVPPFIEVGDIIKVDTRTSDYVQRV